MPNAATLTCLVLVVAMGPAVALEAESTMTDWSLASSAERNTLLDALGPSLSKSFRSERADVLACLNVTAKGSAHASLSIREVLQACVGIVEQNGTPGQSHDVWRTQGSLETMVNRYVNNGDQVRRLAGLAMSKTMSSHSRSASNLERSTREGSGDYVRAADL